MSRLALVLPGGGYRGAKQVGPAKELFSRKTPSIIQGVSVGALNAAGLVEVGPDGIEARWKLIEKSGPNQIFNWRTAAFHVLTNALFSTKGLDDLVNKMDMSKIIGSPIELQVVTRNETTQEHVIFSNRDPRMEKDPEIMRKAIKASASLPGFFPAVEIEGAWYSDGYYFDLERLADCSTILIIFNEDSGPLKDLHNMSCFKRMFVGYGEVLDDMISEQIQNFLDHHNEFTQVKFDSDINPLRKVTNWLIQKAKKTVGIGGQLIAMSLAQPIPTLELDTFRQASKSNPEGDISKAIRLSQEQAARLFDQITL